MRLEASCFSIWCAKKY